ncbi:hypothetical protein DXB06_09260 [Butyricicoccus sp. OF13-6]|nr:hypothetical protein DXB06_09260 [Butyricicoccus sp. OF13-6]
MSMKHIGTKILAGVLVVLLAGAGVLIWRNLPEDAPRLQEPEVQPDTTATLCVAGDIVAHMPLVADAWNGEAYDFTHLFADARRYYEAADYTTACLETTFNGPPYSGYPQFCAPDALAYGLKTVGFNLLSTASNHSMDTWYSGLVRTLDVLDAAGLEHVGTYRTQQERDTVKIIDVGGIKLAMLAYTFSTNGLPVDSEHPYSVSVYTTDYMTDCSAVDYDLIQSDLDRRGSPVRMRSPCMYTGATSTTPSRPSSRSSWRTTCLRTARHWCSAGTRMCRSRWSCGRCRTDAPAICATVSAT